MGPHRSNPRPNGADYARTCGRDEGLKRLKRRRKVIIKTLPTGPFDLHCSFYTQIIPPELGRLEPDRPEPDRPELDRPEPDRPEPDRPEPDRPEPDRPTRPERHPRSRGFPSKIKDQGSDQRPWTKDQGSRTLFWHEWASQKRYGRDINTVQIYNRRSIILDKLYKLM